MDAGWNASAKRYPGGKILVANLPGVALLQDTNLVNAWGMSFSATSPFWLSDNGSGLSTLYAVTYDTNGVALVTKQGLQVGIPGEGNPTGQLFNSSTNFHTNVFIFAGEDGRKRCAGVILRLRLDCALGQSGQSLDDQGSATLGEQIKELRGGLLGSDGQRLLQQDRPGVEALFEQHRRVAGEDLTHRYGPLNRRGSAITRKKAGVKIDAAESRQREHPRRNQAPICDNNNCVGCDHFKPRAKILVIANLLRLRDFDAR